MRPVAWVAIEKFLQQAVWLLLFFILAPMLGPRPFGQFAIVMVFIGFCELVLVQSAVEALLGMDPLEPKHLRTATLSGLSLAILVGGAVFLSAPIAGWIFGDDELPSLFRLMSVLPVIAVLSSAPVALLKSQLRFGRLALRSILGLAAGGICGIALALYGAGVWALAAQAIVQRAAEVIILWSSAHTRFGLGWSNRHFSDLRHFAANVFFSRGMGFAGAQIPRLILGFFLGAFELGLFVFASRLPEILIWTTIVPSTEVARVTLRQFVPGQKDLEDTFRRLLEDTALVAFPVCCGAAALIPLVFAILLDDRWRGAAFAGQLMILSVVPMVVFIAASSLLLAMKHPREEAKISAAQVMTGLFCVLLAAPFGLNVACFVIVIRHLLLMPMLLRILSRRCGIAPRSIAAAIGPALIASLLMGCAVTLAAPVIEQQLGQMSALPALAGLGALIYAAIVWIVAREAACRIIANARRFVLKEGAAGGLE